MAMPQRKRILVADDQGVNRKLTMRRLEQLGFEVDIVENGLQVIEAVNRTAYDLVFMDCHMPHLDGFRAAEWIRQLEGPRRRTPIVAFTASAGATDRQRCLSAGMDDFVSKPIEESELLRVVARWLGSAEAGAPHIDREELIEIFLADAPTHIDAIRDSLRTQNATQVAEAAHALKSGSGNVGAKRIYELCEELETNADDPTMAAKIFDQLETEFRNWRS
ncbi:MAG TPA: response regulator [Thermoanaerobaculia bacterium]|nr:response regulator [Thermoanaerobaculia bacterium]